MAGKAELDDEIVEELLNAGLVDVAAFKVAFGVDVEEGGHTAEGHGRAVLFLDGGQIGEVGPLDGFLQVGGGLGDVEAVHGGHFLHEAEEGDLLEQLFGEAYLFGIQHVIAQSVLVLLLLFDEAVDAVQGHAAIVADDAAAAVGVGQAGDNMALAGGAHFVGIGAEHALVMGGAEAEFFLHLVGELVAVGLAGLLGHAHTAEGVHAALQGAVGLQAENEFAGLVDIAGGIAGEGRDRGGIHIEHAAELAFEGEEAFHLLHEGLGAGGGFRKEGVVAFIFLIVELYEAAHVDAVGPCALGETVPVPAFHKSSPCGEGPLCIAREIKKGRHSVTCIAQTVGIKTSALPRGHPRNSVSHAGVILI